MNWARAARGKHFCPTEPFIIRSWTRFSGGGWTAAVKTAARAASAWTYHKNSVCHDLDWLELKQQCKQYGIYNSQLTSPAPNTSTSLFMMASAGFMPHYAEYFYEDNKDGKTPVSSMYGKDNPIFYANSIGYFKQYELTKAVGAGQKFVDTGISAEYVLDRNIHEITAKDVSMLVKEAWKNGNKTVYYLRTIKVGEQLVKTDEFCSSCSG